MLQQIFLEIESLAKKGNLVGKVTKKIKNLKIEFSYYLFSDIKIDKYTVQVQSCSIEHSWLTIPIINVNTVDIALVKFFPFHFIESTNLIFQNSVTWSLF